MWKVSAIVVLSLAACGGTSGAATPTPSQPTPTATPTAVVTPTPSASPVACGPMSGGTSERARITDMRIGTDSGSDALVIQFDTAVTQYNISRNVNGVRFTGGGGKGGVFTLEGVAGLQLNISNLNWTEPPGNQYPHGTDLKQTAPTLLEVRQIGDFEGTANIAIGLRSDACPSVRILSTPPQLVLQFPAS